MGVRLRGVKNVAWTALGRRSWRSSSRRESSLEASCEAFRLDSLKGCEGLSDAGAEVAWVMQRRWMALRLREGFGADIWYAVNVCFKGVFGFYLTLNRFAELRSDS